METLRIAEVLLEFPQRAREEVLYRPRRAIQSVRDLLYGQSLDAGENEDLLLFRPELLQ